ncbi:MAG: class I SAM-dependent methyltransferase [Rhodospirillales bacterium]|nr:class I SAM-dependent methyltransferase [Rhodospirillales bacterium]
MTPRIPARPPARAWCRRAGLGLPTVLGLRPRGFFIPYRYAATLPGPGERPPYAALEALFQARRANFAEALAGLEPLAQDLEAIGAAAHPAPRWNQSWFPRLDAAMAYGFVRHGRPKRIVEVGSGHSTRFLARAVSDGGLETRILAIDPAPRAAVSGLPVELHRVTLQEAGMAPFRDLGPGDLLMVDSSHILMPGSDVDVLLGRILPSLAEGVWVHFHDIFLPDDYPAAWNWRGYNEQLAVLALLLGGGWQAGFSSRYAVTRMAEDLARSVVARLPLPEGALESGLWLCRGGPGSVITPF